MDSLPPKPPDPSPKPQLVHSYTLKHSKKIELIPATVEERTTIVISPQGFYLLPNAMSSFAQRAQPASNNDETILVLPPTSNFNAQPPPTFDSNDTHSAPLDLSNKNENIAPVITMTPMVTTPLITTMAPMTSRGNYQLSIPNSSYCLTTSSVVTSTLNTSTFPTPSPFVPPSTTAALNSSDYHYSMAPYRVLHYRPPTSTSYHSSLPYPSYPRYVQPMRMSTTHHFSSSPTYARYDQPRNTVSSASAGTSLPPQPPSFTQVYQDFITHPATNDSKKKKRKSNTNETCKTRSKAKKDKE